MAVQVEAGQGGGKEGGREDRAGQGGGKEGGEGGGKEGWGSVPGSPAIACTL